MSKKGEFSSSDIGKRVTIRLHDNPGYRDLVGHLLTPTSLKNRHGEILEFNPADIYIWREIIEVPRTATSGAPLSMRVYEIERASSKTWLAKESVEIGNWVFRADVGITRRANSALVLGNDNHIDEVITWYRARDLQPTVSIVPNLAPELDQELERRGFKTLLDVHVMVKDKVEAKDSVEAVSDFAVSDQPSAKWLAVHGDEKISELLNASPAKYLTLEDAGSIIAIGRISEADGWAIISRIWVAPEARGRGLGRKVLRALENYAAAAKLALQVASDNDAAIELYKTEGYEIHHTYRLRSQSQQIGLSQDCLC